MDFEFVIDVDIEFLDDIFVDCVVSKDCLTHVFFLINANTHVIPEHHEGYPESQSTMSSKDKPLLSPEGHRVDNNQ